MLRRGHRVRVLCPDEARIRKEAGRYGVPVEVLPIGRKNMKGLAAMVGWVRAEGSTHSSRIFNTHSSTDSWLVSLAMLALGNPAPIVRTRHISAKVSGNWMTRWLYGKAAAKVVTTGQLIRRRLIDEAGVAPGNIESVPTGIDTARFVPGDRTQARAELRLPSDKKLVGIVATLRSWKGHRYLIEAFKGLPGDSGLVIVGDGPQRDALRTLIEDQGLTERVWMTGNQINVVPWLQALDVFALPSYANEGVPQALIQAMLVGLPCVTTNAGSIGELARHEETALVVPMQDAVALREGLSRLILDESLRKRLGDTARANCLDRYSLERMLDDMESVFEGVILNVRK